MGRHSQAGNFKKQRRSEQIAYIILSRFAQLVPRAPVMGENKTGGAQNQERELSRWDDLRHTESLHLPKNTFLSDLPTTSATCFSELENQKFLLTAMSVIQEERILNCIGILCNTVKQLARVK